MLKLNKETYKYKSNHIEEFKTNNFFLFVSKINNNFSSSFFFFNLFYQNGKLLPKKVLDFILSFEKSQNIFIVIKF